MSSPRAEDYGLISVKRKNAIDPREFGLSPISTKQQSAVQSEIPQKRNLLQMFAENPLNPLQQIKAVPQEIQDVLGLGSRGIEALFNAPQAIQESSELISRDPKQALRAFASGVPELGHELINTPYNIANYLQQRGLIPKELAEIVPSHETFLKRPFEEDLNKTFGLTGEPGENFLKGIIPNLPSAVGAGKIAAKIAKYPGKLSAKSIMEDIVKTGEEQSAKFEKEYGELFKKAESRKTGNFDLSKIDDESIKLRANPKYTDALDDFLNNPTLENAQSAQSDLGKYVESLRAKDTLTKRQKKSYKAALEAQKYIKENMFKDKEGKIHEDLLNEYEEINSRYPSEKLSYSQNKAIKKYKKGKLVPKEALQKISKGEFYAQRGHAHPEIDRRSLAKILGIGVPTAYGIYEGGKGLLRHLLGK